MSEPTSVITPVRVKVDRQAHHLEIEWPGNQTVQYPFTFLRANCPSAGERLARENPKPACRSQQASKCRACRRPNGWHLRDRVHLGRWSSRGHLFVGIHSLAQSTSHQSDAALNLVSRKCSFSKIVQEPTDAARTT